MISVVTMIRGKGLLTGEAGSGQGNKRDLGTVTGGLLRLYDLKMTGDGVQIKAPRRVGEDQRTILKMGPGMTMKEGPTHQETAP